MNNEVMSNTPPKHIVFAVGETSGDMHAAHIIDELKKQKAHHVAYSGLGGNAMRYAGVNLISNDLAKYSVVGITEVVKHFKVIKQAFRAMQQHLRETKPDLLILIDYPGFNLRLARYAKSIGIPVLYYISPQVWAWKAKRINTIRDTVAMMAVILPFEVPIYEKAHVPVRYVGHPLLKTVKPSMSLKLAQETFGLRENALTIGLMPGSRRNELKRLLPTMLKAAKLIKQQFPRCQFILPIAENLSIDEVMHYLGDNPLDIKLTTESRYDAINCCHSVITASGTATLEIALLGKPMVIIYRVSRLTFLIGRMLVKIRMIGLCNLLAGEMVVPELVQHLLSPESILREIKRYINEPEYYQETVTKLQKIKTDLANVPTEHDIASTALEMLNSA